MTPDNDNDIFGELPAFGEDSVQDGTDVTVPDLPVQELQNVMHFSCLKCAATTEIDFSQMPEEGVSTPCASCNARIRVIRESCARRAGQRSREIFCVKCGHQLDHHLHCPSCGFPFPDYFIVENPEEARRQARDKRITGFRNAASDFGSAIGSIFRPRPVQEREKAYTPGKGVYAATKKTVVLTRNLKVALASLLVVVIAVAGGAHLYHRQKAEQQYVKNYIRAVYGIKVGADNRLNVCARMSTEWKEATRSGRNYVPRVNMDEDVKAQKTKAEIDKLLQQLQKAPPKYAPAFAKLTEFNNSYAALYALASSPPRSPEELDASVSRSEKAFNQSALALKANLPEKLAKELETAKAKYRGLAAL